MDTVGTEPYCLPERVQCSGSIHNCCNSLGPNCHTFDVFPPLPKGCRFVKCRQYAGQRMYKYYCLPWRYRLGARSGEDEGESDTFPNEQVNTTFPESRGNQETDQSETMTKPCVKKHQMKMKRSIGIDRNLPL